MALKAQAQFTNPYEQAYVTYHSSPFFNEDAWRKIASGADASNLNMYIDALSKSKSLDYKKFTKDYDILPGDVDSNITALYNEVYGSRIANDDRYQVEVYKYDENGNMLYDANGNAKTELKTVSEYEYNKMVINQNTNNKLREQLQRIKYEARDPGFWATAGAVTVDVAEGMVEFFNKFGSLIYTLGEMAFTDKTFAEDWFSSWDANYKPVLDRIVVDGVSASQAMMDFESQYTYMRDADGNYTTFGRIANGVATTTGEMMASFITGGILSAPITGTGKAASIATKAIHTATYYTPLAFYSMGEQYKQITANGQSVSTAAMFANQALKTGAEIAIEIGLGKLFGSTGLDKWLFGSADAGKIAKKIGKPSLLRGAGKLVSEAAQEGLEEFLQEFSGYFVDTAFSVIDDDFSQEFEWQNFIDAAIIGAITSGLHSFVTVGFTPTTEITGSDGKVTKLGKFASYYYNANIGSLVETLKKAQVDVDALFTSMPKNTKLKSLEKQRSELQSQVDEIDERLASHDQSPLQMEQALAGGLGEGYSLNENLELIENYAKSQEADLKRRNELAARVKSLDDNIEQVKSLTDNSTETEEHWIEEAQKNNYAANMDKLYIAARAVQSFANIIGDERLAKAEQILTNIKTAAEEGRFNEVEATKSSVEMIKELQLSGAVVTKSLTGKIIRAGIRKIKHIFNRDDELEESTNQPIDKVKANKFADALLAASKERKTVVIAEDGEHVAADEQTIVVPAKIADQGPAQALHNEAEHRLVDAILGYNFKGNVIHRVHETYKKLYKSNATEYDAVCAVLYDESFFLAMLTGENKKGADLVSADLDMFQFLSSLIDIQKAIIPKDIRDGVYKTKLDQVRKSMSKSLVAYLKIQPNADYNLDILTPKQKDEVRAVRESYAVANRIVTGKATIDDLNFIYHKIDSSLITKEQKEASKKLLAEGSQTDKQMLLAALDESYRIAFYGAYDGTIYLPTNSLKNRAVNQLLYNLGTTASNLVNLQLDSNSADAIARNYGTEPSNFVEFLSDKLGAMTSKRYGLEVVTDKETDPKNGVFKSGDLIIKVVDKKSVFNSPDFSAIANQKDKTHIKPSTRHASLISVLLSPQARSKGAGYYTVDDLVTDPGLLRDDTRKAIEEDYLEVTPETTYMYLKSYIAKRGKLTLTLSADGRVILADVAPVTEILAEDFSVQKVKDAVAGAISVAELVDPKYRTPFLNDCQLVLADSPDFSRLTHKAGKNRGATQGVIRLDKSSIGNLERLKTEFAHEFQHVVQEATRLNTGNNGRVLSMFNKETEAEIIAEVREKVPELFKGVPETNATKTRNIVNNFLYYGSGEAAAYGAETSDVAKLYPILVQERADTVIMTLPWGSSYVANNENVKAMTQETDSKGRKLSTEQSEFFVDSQIRTEDGRLRAVYHGTSKDFTIFDIERAGQNFANDSRFGKGFYFANSRRDALAWTEGTRVVEAYLNITKPLRADEAAPPDIAAKIKQYIAEKLANFDTANWPISKNQYAANLNRIESIYLNDVGTFIDVFKYDDSGKMTDGIRKFLTELGYDGIVTDKEVVAFYPNQIKSVDNKTPTESDDINFDLEDDDNYGARTRLSFDQEDMLDTLNDFTSATSTNEIINFLWDAYDLDSSPKESGYDGLAGVIIDTYLTKFGSRGITFVDDSVIQSKMNDGKRYAGLYHKSTGILLSRQIFEHRIITGNYTAIYKTILHEMVHAITHDTIKSTIAIIGEENLKAFIETGVETDVIAKLDSGQRAALALIKLHGELNQKLEAEHNLVKQLGLPDTTITRYGMTNPEEFVAELANPIFRAYLRKESLWDKVVKVVKRLINAIFGGERHTALEVADKIFMELLDYESFGGHNTIDTVEISDEKYLEAVTRKDTMALIAMVKAAATRAGFNSAELYHGTRRFGFTVADNTNSDDSISFFATNKLSVASTYSGDTQRRDITHRLNLNRQEAEDFYVKFIRPALHDLIDGTNALFPNSKKILELDELDTLESLIMDYLTDFTSDSYDIKRELRKLSGRVLTRVRADITKDHKYVYHFDQDTIEQDVVDLAADAITDFFGVMHNIIADNMPKADFNTKEVRDYLKTEIQKIFDAANTVTITKFTQSDIDDLMDQFQHLWETWNNGDVLIAIENAIINRLNARLNFNDVLSFGSADQFVSNETGEVMSMSDAISLRGALRGICNYFSNMFADRRLGNYGLYANLDNALRVDGGGNRWNQIPFNNDVVSTREIAEYAFKDNNYDVVILRNIVDTAAHNHAHFDTPADIYIFKDPARQLRSSDLITYDDGGRVIPLSERFNPESKDFRADEALGDEVSDETIEKGPQPHWRKDKGVHPRKYVSKKLYVGTPLEPWATNPNADRRIHPQVYDFIMKSQEEEYQGINEVLKDKIKDGTLTINDLYDFIRETEPSDEGAEITFKLINETVFHNPRIKSFAELDEYVHTKSHYYYGLRRYLIKIGRTDVLNTVTDPGAYNYAMELLENDPKLKNDINAIINEYWALGQNVNGLRIGWMQSFDGSIYSGGYAASVANVAVKAGWDVISHSPKYKGFKKIEIDTTKSADEQELKDLNDFLSDQRREKLISVMTNAAVDEYRASKGNKTISKADIMELKEELRKIRQRIEYLDAMALTDNKAKKEFLDLYVEYVTDEDLATALYLRDYVSKLLGQEYELVSAEQIENNEQDTAALRELAKKIGVRPTRNIVDNFKHMAVTIKNNLNKTQRKLFLKENGDLFDENLEIRTELYHEDRKDGVKRLKTTSILLEIEDRVRALSETVRRQAYSSEEAVKLRKMYERKMAKARKDYEKLLASKTITKETIRYVTVAGQEFSVDSPREVPLTIKRFLDRVLFNTATASKKFGKSETQLVTDENQYHVRMSYQGFIEINAETLHNLTQDDVNDILDWYLSTRLPYNNSMYSSVELFTLGFIQKMAGTNDVLFRLTDEQTDAIEKRYEEVAHRAGSDLAAWKSVLKELKPNEVMHKAMLKACGIELSVETENELIKAIKSGDMDKINAARKKAYDEAYDRYKGRKRTFFDRLLRYEQMAMLSGPGTWVRNWIGNKLVSIGNNLGEILGGLFVPSEKIGKLHERSKRLNQYQIIGTKIDQAYATWIDETLINNGFLKLISDGLMKWDPRQTKNSGVENRMIKLITAKIESDLFNGASSSTKVGAWAQSLLRKTMSDESAINKAFKTYLGKMLTEDQADISKFDERIMNTVADAYVMALEDYMHKPSFFAKLESSLKSYLHKHFSATTADGIYFMYKQIFPFANASWNWFMEGLNYTPVGLAKAIWQFCKLENTVNAIEEARQKGEKIHSSRFAEYLARRNIGKGVIGTVGFGVGALLCALGLVGFDDDDDEYKLRFNTDSGPLYIEFGDIFGTSGICMGMAFVQSCKDDKGLSAAFISTLNTMFIDSTFADLANLFRGKTGAGEALLDKALDIPGMLWPNFIKTIGNAIASFNKKKPVYRSGIVGRLERFAVQTWAPWSYLMPYAVNPYTGEPEVVNDGWFAANLVSLFTPVKVKGFNFGSVEHEAVSVGVRKGQLSGAYKISGADVKLSSGEIEVLNQYYGKLNAQDLKDLMAGKTKYYVENENGEREELTYRKMTDKQKKAVIERIMSNNSQLAKIYVLTSSKGYKYYANDSEYERLRNAGVISGVYRKTGKYVGFVKN